MAHALLGESRLFRAEAGLFVCGGLKTLLEGVGMQVEK